MRPLDLDDLPAHSEWARYLLDPTGEPPGDPEAYTRPADYDETYARLLDAYRADPVPPERFARRVRAKARADPGPVSVRQDLFLASPDEFVDRNRAAVRDALAGTSVEPETVVDLGCGWGAALDTIAAAFPDAAVVGGEYSPRGVEVARALHADAERVSVGEFDFRGAWDVVADADGDTLVFTRGALTTSPDVDGVVDRVADLARAGAVAGGVHLEQVDVHPETTLGLLRRRYARVRGYSGGLLAALERHEDVEVTTVRYDVLGGNPLHPLTLLRWRVP